MRHGDGCVLVRKRGAWWRGAGGIAGAVPGLFVPEVFGHSATVSFPPFRRRGSSSLATAPDFRAVRALMRENPAARFSEW